MSSEETPSKEAHWYSWIRELMGATWVGRVGL